VLAAADRHGFGWYAWEWGPGNVGGGDPLCEVMDMTADGTLATLKAGWATDVVERMRATAIIPTALR
jgi:mannan endo-1,4-beta-mannosidase